MMISYIDCSGGCTFEITETIMDILLDMNWRNDSNIIQ